jgi:hypothetical protein
VASGRGERRAFLRLGQQVGTGGGHAGPSEGKKEGREQQGNTGEGWGNGSVPLSAGPGENKRDAPAVRTDAFRAQL